MFREITEAEIESVSGGFQRYGSSCDDDSGYFWFEQSSGTREWSNMVQNSHLASLINSRDPSAGAVGTATGLSVNGNSLWITQLMANVPSTIESYRMPDGVIRMVFDSEGSYSQDGSTYYSPDGRAWVSFAACVNFVAQEIMKQNIEDGTNFLGPVGNLIDILTRDSSEPSTEEVKQAFDVCS